MQRRFDFVNVVNVFISPYTAISILEMMWCNFGQTFVKIYERNESSGSFDCADRACLEALFWKNDWGGSER